jgi:tetratricopeptide (TPR) repeat protein
LAAAPLQKVYWEYHKHPRTLDNMAKRLKDKAAEELDKVRQRLQEEAEAAAAAVADAATSGADPPAAAAAGQQGVQLPEVLFDEVPSHPGGAVEAPAPDRDAAAGIAAQASQQRVQQATPAAASSSSSSEQKGPAAVSSQQQQEVPEQQEASSAADAGALSPQQQFNALKEQGTAHFQAGDFRAAEDCWQACLGMDADNAAVLANLCFLYLRMANQLPEGSAEQRAKAQACVRAGKQVLAQPGVKPDVATKATFR